MKRNMSVRFSKQQLEEFGRIPFGSIIPTPEQIRITRQVIQQVKSRSGGACEAVTSVCTSKAEYIHRRSGRLLDNTPGNLLHVCFNCHRYIHDNPSTSYKRGWLLHIWETAFE